MVAAMASASGSPCGVSPRDTPRSVYITRMIMTPAGMWRLRYATSAESRSGRSAANGRARRANVTANIVSDAAAR